MARSGVSRAQENKAIRQEAIRQQLAMGGHIQHVVDIASKLNDLANELEGIEVTRLKYAADIKLKLIGKYLPDLKQIEHTDGSKIGEMEQDELQRRIAELSG